MQATSSSCIVMIRSVWYFRSRFAAARKTQQCRSNKQSRAGQCSDTSTCTSIIPQYLLPANGRKKPLLLLCESSVFAELLQACHCLSLERRTHLECVANGRDAILLMESAIFRSRDLYAVLHITGGVSDKHHEGEECLCAIAQDELDEVGGIFFAAVALPVFQWEAWPWCGEEESNAF